jgi:type IVB pilus formation R64 PilN family outer membrane protein
MASRVLKTAQLASLALVACFALNGCEQSEKTRTVIDQRAEEAKQSLDSTKKIPHAMAYDPLTVTNKVWGGSTATRMQRGMPLPARFEATRGVTLVSSENMSLNDIASAISAQTGIPIRLSSLTIPGKSPAAPMPPPGPNGMPAAASGGNSSQDMPVSYEGPLSGLLDRVSAYYGVSWRFDGSAINVSRYETRIFAIEALPGTQQVNEGMQDDSTSSSGGSSSSSGGGSSTGSSQQQTNTLTQNSKTTMDLKYWDELGQVLSSIVNGQGAAIVSPTMGTVTVTTTPDVMSTISDYLGKENKRLSRQIAINVQIYSVNLGQSEDFNVAFSGFLKNLTKFSGLDYASAAAPGLANTALSASSLGSLSVAILNGSNDPTAHAGDVFNALSTIGDTTSVAQFPMTTLNNHPVSRRVGTDTTYIQSVTQNTTTSTSSSTILTPTTATIHDGFSLQLTPRLLDDGRILLQYSLSLIGLDNLGSTMFSGVPLDLPVTDNRLFVQQSMLRSGQTLMIGGVDQEKLGQNKNGVGSPDNFLLGGGVSTNQNHFMMFMAITPQVMDIANEEHG